MLKPSSKQHINPLEPLIALFVGCLIVSNIISQKFFSISFGGFNLTTDIGTLLLFPLTYIFSDLLTEVYGFATSRRVIWYGFLVNIVAAFLFGAAIQLPHSPDFAHQEAFATILGQVPGLVIASLAGYWFGSFTNDSLLALMKIQMVKWDPSHRWLFLRTIASTAVGQLIDTILFVSLATMVGIFPVHELLNLILFQWVIKTLIEILFTPLTLFFIRVVKHYTMTDIVGTDSWNPFALRKAGGHNLFSQPKKIE